MARARNIKPSLFKNEILGVADPLYTLLFEGLWCLADREGRLEDRPLRIKAEVFPYRDGINSEELLNWLNQNQFIVRYEVDGIKYIQITNFLKHQNPHKQEQPSIIPPFISDYEKYIPNNELNNFGTTSEVNQPKSEALGLIPDSLNTDSLNLIPDSNTFALNDSKKQNHSEQIEFSFETGKFLNITDSIKQKWKEAYPAVDIELNINRAALWLIGNPHKRKKQYIRFLTNWFNRCQEKGGDIKSNQPKQSYVSNPDAFKDEVDDTERLIKDMAVI